MCGGRLQPVGGLQNAVVARGEPRLVELPPSRYSDAVATLTISVKGWNC